MDREQVRDEVCAEIGRAMSRLAPEGCEGALLAEWVLCAAWVDEDGDTWVTRFASADKIPDYRIEGLLRFATPHEMNVANAAASLHRDEDD